ncbi:MAG: hypothetical protein RL266_367 [Bacteroidota bacterium]|jgi:hypothetical protein
MNTFIITTLLTASMFLHNESPALNTEVKYAIERSVADLQFSVPLEVNEKGLVRVQLKVDENGKIQILDANFSHPELNSLVKKQLDKIQVDKQAANEVFYYEFRFEKH